MRVWQNADPSALWLLFATVKLIERRPRAPRRFELSKRISVILKLLRLRFLVGALGERVGWWPSLFTDDIGLRQLKRTFPRTGLRAAFESVSIATRRDHDEKPIPRDSIYLFRLGPIQEDTIAHHLAQGSAELTMPPASADEILVRLDEIGPPDQAAPPIGPCSFGKARRTESNAAVADLARVYAAQRRATGRDYVDTRSLVAAPSVLFYPGTRIGQFGLCFLGFYAEDPNDRSSIIGGTA